MDCFRDAFFLFFSGISANIPLVAASLIGFYGGSVWSIFPVTTTHVIILGGSSFRSSAGFIMAMVYRKKGPQKPEVVWDEEEKEDET